MSSSSSSSSSLSALKVYAAQPPNDEEALSILTETTDVFCGSTRTIHYGTAGFREKVNEVPLMQIMVRTAAFAVLRSLACHGSAIGIMITASHNDESYNGVKIADANGGMMDPTQEASLVRWANHVDVLELWNEIIVPKRSKYRKTNDLSCPPACLYLGRDTRSHSQGFSDNMVRLARAMGSRVVDLGVVTTPMLHHSVLHANAALYLPKTLIPTRPGVAGYLDLLAYSYTTLLNTHSAPAAAEIASATTTAATTNATPLLVDCACGVGYPALTELVAKIQSLSNSSGGGNIPRPIHTTNAPGAGPLNHRCGSEHVQKGLGPPTWYHDESSTGGATTKEYCAALDGDADRIVFFSSSIAANSNDEFILLDGDKISCLLCEFIQEQIQVVKQAVPSLPTLKLGVVQTAYANGASTDYLRKILGRDGVCIAKTGVKHLHAAAHDHFDIGIYFEANGHGTVLFGPQFYRAMDEAQQAIVFGHDLCGACGPENSVDSIMAAPAVSLERLSLLPSLVNQAVGDALSDLLLVDAILTLKGWTLQDWALKQYTDYPSRQIKVKVADRTVIQTNDNETLCVAPSAVQEALNQAMQEIGSAHARTFVRPSGTEDVVRIYAEATTREQADQLALRAARIVHQHCGGVDAEPPTSF